MNTPAVDATDLVVPENTGQLMRLDERDLRDQANLIQRVMKAVMKPDTHYGVIPGTKKPTLYKAGSEILLSTFRIAVDPEVEDLSTDDEIRYRVRCVGRHMATGMLVGVGIGECSSNEEKYKWRRAVCGEEYDVTPETRCRLKFSRYKGQVEKTQQIRTEPADVANTVLKMAKKRAQIDLTLTATAASDIFAQDLEDLPPEHPARQAEVENAPADPQRKSAAKSQDKPKGNGNGGAQGEPIGVQQFNMINGILDRKGIAAAQVMTAMDLDGVPLEQLPRNKVNDALQWIQEQPDT